MSLERDTLDYDPETKQLGWILVLVGIAGLVCMGVSVSVHRELSLSWRLIGVMPVTAEVTSVESHPSVMGSCVVTEAYHPVVGATTRRWVDLCTEVPQVGDTYDVQVDPRNRYNFRRVDSWAGWNAGGLVGLALLPLGFAGWRWRRRQRVPAWITPTRKALEAEGMQVSVLPDGALKLALGTFDKSGSTMSLSLSAGELPPCHISRATVLPGETLEVGELDFDDAWRLKTPDPVGLALALSPAARQLLEHFDGCAVDGRLRLWGTRGHPTTFIRVGLQLLEALQVGCWGDVRIPGLRREERGLIGQISGLPVRVSIIADPPDVSTRVVVSVASRFRAARSGLEGQPTRNVVLDQLIRVRGDFPAQPEDVFVELLLEVVHGLDGQVFRDRIAVEVPGVPGEGLIGVVQACVDLGVAIRLIE